MLGIDIKAYLTKRGFKVLEVKEAEGDFIIWIDGRVRPASELLEVFGTANPEFGVQIIETYGMLPKFWAKVLLPYYKIKHYIRSKRK